MCYLGKICVKNQIDLLNMSSLQCTKFAAVSHLAEGQFLCAIENWVKFLILQEGTLRLILPVKEGQNLDPKETRIKKRASN
jgi:hypothetical protein